MTSETTIQEEPLFKPEPHGVERFFSLKWPLYVDPYQRDYAWEADEEIADFIADLKRVVEQSDSDSQAPPHFFGLIVAARHSNEGWERSEKLEIIDGQQRLATFSLFGAALVAAAKDLVKASSAEGDSETADRAAGFAASLVRVFIEAEDTNTQTWKPMSFTPLRVTEPDDLFFRRLLQGGPDKPKRHSHELLLASYESLRDAIDDWLAEPASLAEKQERLAQIRSAVLTRSELILIQSNRKVDAYRVFSILNDRGKQLEQADLLRSYVLSIVRGSDDDTRREVAADWNHIDRESPEHVDAALRAYYASRAGRRAPKVDVFDAYRRDILASPSEPPNEEEVTSVVQQVKEIRGAAHVYRELTDGTWPAFPTKSDGKAKSSEWERKLIPRLTRNLKSQRVIPLLMSAAAHWIDDEATFVRVLRFVEKAEVRLLVGRAHASAAADRLFEAARQARTQGPAELIAFIEPRVYQLVDDEAFKTRLEALRYTRNTALIRHLLAMAEDHLAWYRRGAKGSPTSSELRTFDMGKVTLDHIYPQSPKAGEVDQELEPLRHNLGNLTILVDQDNSSISNLLPAAPEKLSVYDLAVQMTREVAETIRKSGWSPSSVSTRQDELVAILNKVYAISPEAKAEAAKLGVKRGRRAAAAAEVRTEPRLWCVSFDEKSKWDDIPGKTYRFGTGLRAGASIQAGDFMFVFTRKRVKRKRDWPHDEIRGIGKVGVVDVIDGVKPRLNRRARFSQYLFTDPPISFEDLGVDDPRDPSQNSIKDGSLEQLESAVKLAGLDDIADLPHVDQESDAASDAT
jgi:Protein of unknown function DUF262/Protein of unknown function (DUF1524)